MAFDPTKLHMGPAEVTWNNVHLGYTLNDSVKSRRVSRKKSSSSAGSLGAIALSG